MEETPSYEGPYNVLYDAVDNDIKFGEKYGMVVTGDKLDRKHLES